MSGRLSGIFSIAFIAMLEFRKEIIREIVMLRCSSCETELRDGSKFCGNCGKQVGSACYYCSHVNGKKSKFCEECGRILFRKHTGASAQHEGLGADPYNRQKFRFNSIPCIFGIHKWKNDPPNFRCFGCGQVEVSHKNIHGDTHRTVEMEGVGLHTMRWLGVFSFFCFLILYRIVSLVDDVTKIEVQMPAENSSVIKFSNFSWRTKSSPSLVGPGPNYFMDSNVLVDKEGKLHLKLAKRKGNWTTSEVYLRNSLGYGAYKISIDSFPDSFDEKVILGFLTWDNSPNENHREIDIEIGKRVKDGELYNGAFTVQPWDKVGHSVGIQRLPQKGYQLIFSWEPKKVEFFMKDNEGDVVQTWKFSSKGIPSPGNEKIRINFWLRGGIAPAGLKESEVVISKFEFTPFVPKPD